MSEFKLHHLVRELLEMLRSKNTPEEYLECLQKSMNSNKMNSISHIAIQSQVQNLALKCTNQQAFMGKYEDLKQKNVDCLGSFIQLLHLISEDTSVKDFLLKTVKTNSLASDTCSRVTLTKDDLPQVKYRLKKAVTKKRITIDSNTSRLLNRSGPPMAITPSVTSWVQRRPSMSWDFSTTSSLSVNTQIIGIPSTSQESLLIEDLLNILMGLPGCYIEPLELKGSYEPREFTINECVDPSLKELIRQILPLASHYSIVQRFTEEKMRFEYGQVNNALAECMSAIIVEYTLFVTQLETESRNGNLNLHKMWYYIQTNMHSLSIVGDIATRVNKVLATLNFLASGCFQNSIGTNNFIALSQSSISRIIKEVCEVMTIHLMKQWIKFPTNTVDKNQVKQGFYEKWGARGVVGVIDGTHVDILAPPVADEYHPPFVYINRKGKYSINVMLSDAVGGKVLSLLHDQISAYIGDYKAQDLCVHLMQAASVPYMKMLGMWIYKGIISDPIDEFLVEDQEVVQKEDMPIDYSADYWDKKYIIRRERIPKFLEPVADIILRAGKYLNVIRQCGRTLNHKVEIIEYKLEERHYFETIENAYKYASQTLLDLVMRGQDLLGRLKSVKHYFLLDQGNFIVTFLALCEKELSKNINDVIQARLDSLLDLALRLSCSFSDPYKDDLRTELLPYDLQFQMFKILSIQTMAEPDYWSNGECVDLSVIQTFTFNYEVRWPVSLILNRKSLACYQMIFRHLFYCKYVERMICQVWKSNKVTKKFPVHAAKQYRNAFALRQRMLHCVQNLEYHMMVEVIEPHWCCFIHKISKVSNVDEILSCHFDFLDACLKDCMLTIPDLLSIVTKILAICVSFCKFMQGENGFQADACEYTEPRIESFKDSISKLDIEFTSALMQLLDQINDMNRGTSDYERLFNLLYRLDFNLFYSGKFEAMGLNKLKMEASASG